MDEPVTVFCRWVARPNIHQGTLHVDGDKSIERLSKDDYEVLRKWKIRNGEMYISEIQLIKPKFGFVPAY